MVVNPKFEENFSSAFAYTSAFLTVALISFGDAEKSSEETAVFI